MKGALGGRGREGSGYDLTWCLGWLGVGWVAGWVMILEGLVTTLSAGLEEAGREAEVVNLAPMGPLTDEGVSFLTFRPYRSSRTYRNLKAHPEGVFHVTDDVYLLAQGAIGEWTETVPMREAERVRGRIVEGACRWYEFRVTELDDSAERTTIQTEIVAVGRGRDYFGLNRAKHAVLEAAILATRLHLLPKSEIEAELARLRVPVEKTAGARERAAFELVVRYVAGWEPVSETVSASGPAMEGGR